MGFPPAGGGGSPTGAAGGVLSGTYPSPGMASGAAATNLGAAGGSLTGTYPSPTLTSSGITLGTGTSQSVQAFGITSGKFFSLAAGTSGTPDTAASTTATGVNAINSATVNVGDTSAFPASGSFVMGAVVTAYTGTTATSFTGCGNHAATTGGELIYLPPTPPIKVSRLFSNLYGSTAGDGGQNLAGISADVVGDAANQLQSVGVYGAAGNSGTTKGAADSPDGCGIYGIGRITGSGIGVGIGAFLAGRKDTATAKISGIQVSAENYSGSDSSYSSSAFTDSAVWVTPAGNNKTAAGILFGNPFGVQFDVGIGFNAQVNGGKTGAVATASIRDDSTSLTSIAINGTHATASIAVAASAGNITMGGNNKITSLADGGASGEAVAWPWPLIGAVKNVQIFTANGTWSKPGTGTFALVIMRGAGGGGGGGTTAASGGSASGGAGGGSAGFMSFAIPLTALGSSASVTVGTGGAGGTAGNPGSNGSATTQFDSVTGNCTTPASVTPGNGGGAGASATTSTGGTAGTATAPVYTGYAVSAVTTNGSAGGNGTNTAAAGANGGTNGAGGAGGGFSTGPAAQSGGQGTIASPANTAAGAAGTAGNAGGVPATPILFAGSSNTIAGGGGGGGNTGGSNAGKGADGLGGGGGGGGGSCVTGGTAGTGGKGGDPVVIVLTY